MKVKPLTFHRCQPAFRHIETVRTATAFVPECGQNRLHVVVDEKVNVSPRVQSYGQFGAEDQVIAPPVFSPHPLLYISSGLL